MEVRFFWQDVEMDERQWFSTLYKEAKEDSVRKKQAKHLRDKYGDKTKTPASEGGE